MTAGGWVIMLFSVGFVTGFFGWCIWKVLATPESTQHLQDPKAVDTHDIGT